MIVNDAAPLTRLVEEMMLLIQETADFHRERHEAVAAALDGVVRSLMRIRSRLLQVSGRYVVAFVGAANVGKSTLLNAILGCDVAPRRNGPCTAAPIEFERGDQLGVTVHLHRQIAKPWWPCENVDDLQRRLTALADDQGDEASRAISKVVVQVPSEALRDDLVIADTPGFGAAQLGDADGAHESSLCEYLKTSVCQVFAVVLAEQGIAQRENAFFQRYLGHACDDVVVTGSEDWNADERRRFRKRFLMDIGGQAPRMHFVSGLAGSQARASGDAAALETAGIVQLERHLASLAEPKGRLQSLAQRVQQIADDLGDWLADQRDDKGRALNVRWPRASWLRWIAAPPGGPFKRELIAKLSGSDA